MAQAFHTEAQAEFRGQTRLEETDREAARIAELAHAARTGDDVAVGARA